MASEKRYIADIDRTTFTEIPPNPADYPGALPHVLYAGGLVFQRPTGPMDRRDIGNRLKFDRGA